MPERSNGSSDWKFMIAGIVTIIAGLFFLMGNMGWIFSNSWSPIMRYWPVILLLTGIVMMIKEILVARRNALNEEKGIRLQWSGSVFTALGLAFLIDNPSLKEKSLLPVFFISLGILIIVSGRLSSK